MSDRPTRRMEDLVETLLWQTRAHAIRWKRTDLPGAYAYPSRSGSVVVRGPRSGEDGRLSSAGYSVRVLNSFGDVVEQYENRDGSLTRPFVPLKDLVDEIVKQYEEGDPLIDRLRNEVAAARP